MKPRLVTLILLCGLLVGLAPAPATAAPAWAPAAEASIRPGATTLTGDGLCTSNFVFFDGNGDVYLGQAAHCSSTSEATQLDGCINSTLPVGSPVRISGATRPGTMVYNSWIAMQERGETDLNACLFNDFALVRVDPEDRFRVNPTIPFWGGPTGMVPTSLAGADAFGFGTTIQPDGLTRHAKRGVTLRQAAGGWTHVVQFEPVGIAGDSGSGIIDGQGRAFGVMSTLSLRRSINGAGDLSRLLDYARTSGFEDLTMAQGTEPLTLPAPAPQDPIGDLLRALLAGLLGG